MAAILHPVPKPSEMKTLLRSFALLLLVMITLATQAQTAGVAIDKEAKAWIGLNVGGLWQNSDVKSTLGGGAGLTFDYYFIRNKTSLFGIGVRGQYLQGLSTGMGLKRDFNIQNNTALNGTSGNPNYASLPSSDAYVFQNFSTSFSDFSGNVIINLNRLRAVSRLNIYVFGGIGATGYVATTNQLDASNNLYDYSGITTVGKALIKKELNDVWDDSYETYTENGKKQTWAFNTTVGAGFGVQLSKRVQLGIEHKVGFTATDLLDANRWGSNSRNDIYQYSSMGITVGLGKVDNVTPVTTNTQTTTTQVTETRVYRPVVRITSPTTTSVTTETCVAAITAEVDNIVSGQNISVTQNGVAVNFNLSGNLVTVSNIAFTGTAEFIIRATNSAGSVERSVSFTCTPRVDMITICHKVAGAKSQSITIPAADWRLHEAHGDTRGACPVIPSPVITITSPTTSPVTLENCTASITARVDNVTSRQNIQVTNNNAPINFEFIRNIVSVSNLVFSGTANVVIKATNESGSNEQAVSFICKPRVEMMTICHQISGAASQTINIDAREWGAHAAHGDTRGACPVILPPDVVITAPASSPVTAENCLASIAATVKNVSNKQNISVTQNGVSIPFTFSGTQVAVFNVSFTGTADFIIRASNSAGTAEQTASFICKPRVEMITICHQVPGSAPQSINIPTTDWSVHAAHGDTRGTCPVIPAPVVTITSPATSPTTTEDCIASISARVENVLDKNNITVTQNGATIPFIFNQNTVTVSTVGYTGTADFTIKAINSSGTNEKTVSFICKPRVEMITICHKVTGAASQSISIPASEWTAHSSHGDTRGACAVVPAPSVTITSPAISPVASEDCMASVTARVDNISVKENIIVSQNGVSIPFMFDGKTVTFTNVRVTATTNFVIKATNATGSDEKSVSFICKPKVEMITICHRAPDSLPQSINIPVTDWETHASHGDTRGTCPIIPLPTVTITLPANSPVTLENCVAAISATVENVSDKQNISVTQNGTPVAFTFSGNNVSISNVSFTGTADFVIRANNGAGSAEKSVSFICKPKEKEIVVCHYPPGNTTNPQSITIPESAWPAHRAHGDTQGACPVLPAPVLTITTPSSSPVVTENCVASINATVENVLDKQNISVTLNGSPVAFSFSGNTVSISGLTFDDKADFVIKATNASGSDQQSVSFTCKPKEKEIAICHYPPGNKTNPQAITIPESAWSAHQAHGDTQGTCPVIPAPVLTITTPSSSPMTLKNCVASVAATVENVSDKQNISVTMNGSPVAFSFSGNTVTVSDLPFEDKADFVIKITNASGSDQQSVSFVCEPKEKEITICHYPPDNKSNPQSITIPESAWSTHEAHGDIKGSCPVIPAPEIIITSPDNSSVTLETCVASLTAIVKNISDKQNISVTQNGSPVSFNFSGNTVSILNLVFTDRADFVIQATNASGSDQQSVSFICKPKEKEITICHYPPGNKTNPQAITIPESAWPAHEAHGDIQGACPVIPNPVVTITSPTSSPVTLENCVASLTATIENVTDKQGISVTRNGSDVAFDLSGNTVTVSNISFTGKVSFKVKATNASGSDEKSVSFICEPKQIQICHYPPGNRFNPQDISVDESAWPAHEAHGDTQGACPSIPAPELTINSPESPAVVEDCKASIQATVSNVDGKGDISVKMNGKSVPFDYSNGAIQVSNISFKDAATFVITASNRSGSVKRSVEFKCQPKEEEKKEDDKKSDDDEEKITICHHPPGNKDNFQTITIAKSAWEAHQKHGDTLGPCKDGDK